MEAVCTLLGMTIVVGSLIYVIQWMQRHENERSEIWRDFARQQGLTFYPASGSWLQRKPPRIEGTIQDVPVLIDTFVVHRGESSATYTRLTARSLSPVQASVKVYLEHLLSGLGKALGFQDVVVGDATFDNKCIVKANDESQAKTLLDEPSRKALLTWFSIEPAGARMEYDQGEVKLIWVGAERRPDVLRLACSAAIELCRFRGTDHQVFR
jgi:hypothetical protein